MQDNTDTQDSAKFAELQRVRLNRVYGDPIITHSKNVSWGLPDDESLVEHIITARMKRLRDAPSDFPIELATVPEAVAYLASASMDAGAATGTVPALYHIAMQEYTREYGVESPDWLSEKLEGEDFHQKRLTELRREIMRVQDRDFLSERFNCLDLHQLTKSFWDGKTNVSETQRGTAEGI